MSMNFISHITLRPNKHAAYGWDRLSMLIDGIFAIAATLLVFDLKVPPNTPPGHLGSAVLQTVRPQCVAYGAAVLLIMGGWLAIRRLAAYTTGIDHYATIDILFTLSLFILTPYTAKVYTTSNDPADQAFAVRLFCCIMIATAILYAVVVRYLISRGFADDDNLHSGRWAIFKWASYCAWIFPTAAFIVSFQSYLIAEVIILVNLLINFWPNDAQWHDGPSGIPSD